MVVKNTFTYQGSKTRLIPKLKKYIPHTTNFFDVFGGTGVMSLNFGENAYYNEFN